MKNWLPESAVTPPDPHTEKLEDFRALLSSSHAKLVNGRDVNMVYHEHVSAILRMVRPPLSDYTTRPIDGTVEIF